VPLQQAPSLKVSLYEQHTLPSRKQTASLGVCSAELDMADPVAPAPAQAITLVFAVE